LRVRNVLSFISLLLISIAIVFFVISFVFARRESTVTVSLEGANDIRFLMDNGSCIGRSSYERDYAQFYVVNPVFKDYHVISTSPLSFTILVQNGTLITRTMETPSTNPVTTTQEITNTEYSIQSTAKRIDVDTGDRENIVMDENICSSDVYFNPESGTILGSDSDKRLFNKNRLSLITRQDFNKSNQEVQVILNEAMQNGKFYTKIIYRFKSSRTNFGSYMAIFSSGEDTEFTVPYGNRGETQGSKVVLTEANITGAIIRQPKGKMHLERKGTVNFEPPIGIIEHRDLELNGDFFYRGYLLVNPNSNGTIELSGSISSAVYGGEQLITSRWEALPTLYRAPLIGALVGLIFVIPTRWLSNLYTRRKPPVTVPAGHFVFVLSSGRSVAGKLKMKPGSNAQRYALKDVMICDAEGVWKQETIPEVLVEKNKVEYIYIAR
jgi:hypothetical protein